MVGLTLFPCWVSSVAMSSRASQFVICHQMCRAIGLYCQRTWVLTLATHTLPAVSINRQPITKRLSQLLPYLIVAVMSGLAGPSRGKPSSAGTILGVPDCCVKVVNELEVQSIALIFRGQRYGNFLNKCNTFYQIFWRIFEEIIKNGILRIWNGDFSMKKILRIALYPNSITTEQSSEDL